MLISLHPTMQTTQHQIIIPANNSTIITRTKLGPLQGVIIIITHPNIDTNTIKRVGETSIQSSCTPHQPKKAPKSSMRLHNKLYHREDQLVWGQTKLWLRNGQSLMMSCPPFNSPPLPHLRTHSPQWLMLFRWCVGWRRCNRRISPKLRITQRQGRRTITTTPPKLPQSCIMRRKKASKVKFLTKATK